ncbi:MAG: hypothetical protein K2N03_03990 [Muribaculaceae bacterium]|nr:hypothetical protein [Muribaculaceae bacterium]
MNKLYFSFLLSLLVPGVASAELPTDFYANKSVLAEGKWVKISVDKTGVYEISYEALRNMGFENPADVSVFGRGGSMLDASFVLSSGGALIYDDISSVKVLHKGNKIYFYGQGVDKLNFKSLPSNPLGGYFERKSKNIYSDYGYYFLTDSQPVNYIFSEKSENLKNLQEVTSVVKYIHHEKDLKQNTTASGQLFWGEKISDFPDNKAEWDIDLRDAKPDTKGYLRYDAYITNKSATNISIGIEGADSFMSYAPQDNPSSYFSALSPNVVEFELVTDKTKLFFQHNATNPDYDNIDFWTLSYSAKIPSLDNIAEGEAAQTQFAIPGMARGKNMKISFPDASSYTLWDVTDPLSPTQLTIKMEAGVGTAKIWGVSTYSDLVLLDTSRPQLQICGYEDAVKDVTNQNLHAHSVEGADLLIITTPKFKEASERLADLHRQKDGIKVVVATNEECYNEFSQGVPDATAYRSLAYMLYKGKTKLKNVLLVGPITADIRGIESGRNPLDFLIAYQYAATSITAGAYHANDYIGIMEEFITERTLEKTEINLGVGMLPFKYEVEMDNFIKKLESYLNRDDYAYYLNRFVGVGGDGDNHTHDNQMLEVVNWLYSHDRNSTITTPIALEAYGYDNARNKLISALNNGANMMIYFGHGAETMLTQKPFFFNTSHANQLTNDFLPVIGFAGCSLSNSDRDRTGLGETIVTRSPRGAIASIMASRESWAAQNLEFYKSFINCMYRKYDSSQAPYRTSAPTLGEIYANTKTGSSILNELSYQLIGDPAVKIPLPLQNISVSEAAEISLVPGEKVTVKGIITDSSNVLDNSFNGQVVVRVLEPALTLQCQNLITNQTKDSPKIKYEDTQLTLGVAEVNNGIFEVELAIPSSAAQFVGNKCSVKLSAYNPETRMGAGGAIYVDYVANGNASSSEDEDNIAPSIDSISFDSENATVDLQVSDNYALNLSDSPMSRGFFFYIDGKEHRQGLNSQAIVSPDNLSYKRSIRLHGLSYGNHTARVKVKDAAGNEAEQEIIFTYAPLRPEYALMIDEISDDEVVLSFAEKAPSKSIIYIMNANGETIYSEEFSGSTFSWNRRSSSGRKIASGHYKAYIIENSNSGNNGHSDAIDIPLI